MAEDEVTLHIGVDSSRIIDTVLDTTPLAIFTVNYVPLLEELFGKFTRSVMTNDKNENHRGIVIHKSLIGAMPTDKLWLENLVNSTWDDHGVT
nr:fasciclin-like arabinogalactan protein 8 [Quercus suber]